MVPERINHQVGGFYIWKDSINAKKDYRGFRAILGSIQSKSFKGKALNISK